MYTCMYMYVHTAGGVTPLHRACYKGYKDIVRLLLSEGADPQLADNDGMTPLHKVYGRL